MTNYHSIQFTGIHLDKPSQVEYSRYSSSLLEEHGLGLTPCGKYLYFASTIFTLHNDYGEGTSVYKISSLTKPPNHFIPPRLIGVPISNYIYTYQENTSCLFRVKEYFSDLMKDDESDDVEECQQGFLNHRCHRCDHSDH
jgi:hypothetical protein